MIWIIVSVKLSPFDGFRLISAPCRPPNENYVFYPSVDKYYKAVKQKVKWNEAKNNCKKENAILVELKTPKEYQAIQTIFGKRKNFVQ